MPGIYGASSFQPATRLAEWNASLTSFQAMLTFLFALRHSWQTILSISRLSIAYCFLSCHLSPHSLVTRVFPNADADPGRSKHDVNHLYRVLMHIIGLFSLENTPGFRIKGCVFPQWTTLENPFLLLETTSLSDAFKRTSVSVFPRSSINFISRLGVIRVFIISIKLAYTLHGSACLRPFSNFDSSFSCSRYETIFSFLRWDFFFSTYETRNATKSFLCSFFRSCLFFFPIFVIFFLLLLL